MDYRYSEHYREHPIDEINAALSANSAESVRQTLEARRKTEQRAVQLDTDAIERINKQIACVALFSSEVEVAA